MLKVKSLGSTNKGVDRVHNKYIIIKRKAGEVLSLHGQHIYMFCF